MAEPTQFRTRRGCTLVLKSGDGTPKTHTLNFGEGTFSYTNGGRTVVRAKDENGDYFGAPRLGEQAGTSNLSFNGRLYDAGANTTVSVLADLSRQTGDLGYVGSDWTSTNTDSDLQVYTAVLTMPTIGSNNGATYTWTSVVVEPGVSTEVKADGVFLTISFTSAVPEPTVARFA